MRQMKQQGYRANHEKNKELQEEQLVCWAVITQQLLDIGPDKSRRHTHGTSRIKGGGQEEGVGEMIKAAH